MSLIERLESAAKEKGLSLSAVAEKAGASRASATRWRSGGGLSPAMLKKVSEILSVSQDWLKTGAEPSANAVNTPEQAYDLNSLISVATPTYLDELVNLQQAEEKGLLEDSDKAMLKIIANKYKDRL